MMELLRNLFASLNLDKKGQDLTEYALLVALIAIIVVLAVLFFGNNVSSFFSLLGSTVSSWISS
ncbi:Flp family type IVb pilin [Chloroflexota bacterium]